MHLVLFFNLSIPILMGNVSTISPVHKGYNILLQTKLYRLLFSAIFKNRNKTDRIFSLDSLSNSVRSALNHARSGVSITNFQSRKLQGSQSHNFQGDSPSLGSGNVILLRTTITATSRRFLYSGPLQIH